MDKRDYYIAIIGDLVKSRELKNRKNTQNNLNKALRGINGSSFSTTIQSKFVITIGDEFQDLVSRGSPLRHFLNHYNSLFGDTFNTRFGIGLGGLSTRLKSEAIGMDGPCFHNARLAVLRAKKENKNIIFNGFEMDLAINALF